MTATLVGLALSFSILIVIWKWKNQSVLNALADAALLAVVMYLTSGTLTGLLIGSIASFVVSAYLIFDPFEPIRFPQFRLPRFTFKLNIWSRVKSLLHLPTISIRWS